MFSQSSLIISFTSKQVEKTLPLCTVSMLTGEPRPLCLVGNVTLQLMCLKIKGKRRRKCLLPASSAAPGAFFTCWDLLVTGPSSRFPAAKVSVKKGNFTSSSCSPPVMSQQWQELDCFPWKELDSKQRTDFFGVLILPVDMNFGTGYRFCYLEPLGPPWVSSDRICPGWETKKNLYFSKLWTPIKSPRFLRTYTVLPAKTLAGKWCFSTGFHPDRALRANPCKWTRALNIPPHKSLLPINNEDPNNSRWHSHTGSSWSL